MRWRGRRQSQNVEDRRHRNGVRGRRGGIGLGGILVVLGLSWALGIDPMMLLQGVEQAQRPTQGGSLSSIETDSRRPDAVGTTAPEDDEMKQFVSVVLADTEVMWSSAFRQARRNYREPTLVLFTDAAQSACGLGRAAMGPFYCPADETIYIDLSFYDDLKTRFGAPGDFAQAYVIAHEVGHHVQKQLGVSDRITRLRNQADEVESNRLSVLLELQADCLAGVWANDADKVRALLDQGDVAEGLRAAAAIGDDRLQRQSRGYVTPDSFTHGTSDQRVRWFQTGLETGDIGACDTFAAAER